MAAVPERDSVRNGSKKKRGKAGSKAKKARILVIDDEEVVQASLTRMLSRSGHEVRAVSSAQEGLHRLEEGGYDLIISDLKMPEMDGLDLMSQLEKLDSAPPVLMITGYPTMPTAIEAIKHGAVDYISKPFTRRELMAPIARTLNIRTAAPPMDKAVDDQLQGRAIAPSPGDRFRLGRHSWALCRSDGTMDLGINASFLSSVGVFSDLKLPACADQIKQGCPCFWLITNRGDEHGVHEHGVLAPFTGQVINRNEDALPGLLSAVCETWLIRITPSRAQDEAALLSRASGC